ncbi:MAG: DUF2797 domain-containing protein [Sciscionella sp.]
MTEQHSDWRATGLYWNNHTPSIGLVDHTGTEHTEPIPPGTQIGYQLGATRRCTGVWLAGQRRRQPCPFSQPIPPKSTGAQCAPCTAADPGRAFARSTAIDDGRVYALYLAWFGPVLVKVGLTATDRGTDRLAEQGALAFTWLARGRLPAVRAAEQAISASGLASERRQRRTKLAAWWQLPEKTQRQHQLCAAYQQIIETVPWPAGLNREDCVVSDQVELFGLHQLPESCQEITGLSNGAVLAGTVRCTVGRDLLLDTTDGSLLTDTRLLAGWPLRSTTATLTGVRLRACDYARSDNDADQTSLF